MSGLAELRKELRELRKEHVKPVSRMKKQDVAAELEKLRGMRETTPHAAAVPSAPARKMAGKAGSVKESKAKEHPVAPAPKAEAPKKKSGMKAKLAKMLEMMESSDEE